jgi:hypothetical protein
MSAAFVNMRDGAGAGAADGTGRFAGFWGRQTWLYNVHQAWDAISYEWDSRVAGFDQDSQQAFFLNLGWPDTRPLRFFAWLALAIAGLCAMQALWFWWRARLPSDPLRGHYDRFCRRIADLGVTREPWEGPSRFAERAARELPAHAGQIRKMAQMYVALRYEKGPHGAGVMREFRRTTI